MFGNKAKSLIFSSIKRQNILLKIMKRNFAINFTKDPLISVEDAYKDYLDKSKKTVFIDVRDTETFIQSHIPNSLNINEIFSYLSTSDKKGIEAIRAEFQKVFQSKGITGKENIIMYESCLKTRFGASCRGAYLLNLFGYSNVRVLHGSWELWTKKGLPVTSEASPVAAKGDFKTEWNPTIFANKEDVLRAIEKKDAILMDVRDYDEWKGESSSPYGADFAITKDKGITTDKKIIIYCFKGARASNSFIALRTAGFDDITNYFASWNEWSRDLSLPIDDRKI